MDKFESVSDDKQIKREKQFVHTAAVANGGRVVKTEERRVKSGKN